MIEALVYYVVVEAYYFYLKFALTIAIVLLAISGLVIWRLYRTG